jgi:hypothetical protein
MDNPRWRDGNVGTGVARELCELLLRARGRWHYDP